MIHSSAWLGSGVGAGMVVLAACVGVARGPVAPVAAVPGIAVAAVPGPESRRGLAPACAAMHRSGTCLAAGRSPTRLLRT